jgi:sulfate permease, SulP family
LNVYDKRQQLQMDNSQHWLVQRLPFLVWMRQYKRAELPGDMVAGLTVATMLIPQSMAYALLAGLPPIVGLYTGILPVLVYGLLGSTRILTLGPTAITSVMILSSIGGLAEPNTLEFYSLSLTLALTLGIVYLLMGLLRLGFVVNLLSQSVLEGYVNAAASIIAISQIKNLLGIVIPRSAQPAETLLQTILYAHQVHIPTVLLGVMCIAIILFFNYGLNGLLNRLHLNPTLQLSIIRSGSLVAVIVSILVVVIFRLDTQGIDIIGKIPQGFPPLTIGSYDFTEWQTLLTGAVAIAFVGFMEGVSTAKSVMSQRKQTLDGNQELIAMGAANIAGAMTGGMSSTTSISRSAVNHAAGANTGLSSIIAAIMVGLTVTFFTPIFFYLPSTALAAIILTSVIKLFNIQSLRQLWKYSKLDTIPFFVTFFATFLISIPIGIASGILFSLVTYLARTSRPEIEQLGRIDYIQYYRDMLQYKEAHAIPKVMLIRIDESLYFANAQYLDKYLRNMIAKSRDVEHLIVVGDAMNWLDASAVQILEDLIHDFEQVGVKVYFTELNLKVWGRISKIGFMSRVGEHRFFHRTHDAVKATGALLDNELPI